MNHAWTSRQLQPCIASCSHSTLCISVISIYYFSQKRDILYRIESITWPDERLDKKIYFPDRCARQNTLCHWQHHYTYCKVSYHMFIFVSSKEECWQRTICFRYIQQNSLLALVSGKNRNSSICRSGRLQALLNQACQFHTDFYHGISITWLSAPNLFF